MVDGKPYFPATECAKILGYATPRHAVSRHCRGGTKRAVTDSLGREQQKTFIPEGDLYRLIIRSKLPAAVRFEAWVCDEVLPTIRQYGAYVTDSVLNKMQEDNLFTEELLQELSREKSKNTELLTYVGAAEPKVHYYETVLQNRDVLPITLIAKDYGMSAQKLNQLLKGLGVQYKCKGSWVLYSKHCGNGYTISQTHNRGGEVHIHMYWTQKGRVFLYDLLKWYGIMPEAEKERVSNI